MRKYSMINKAHFSKRHDYARHAARWWRRPNGANYARHHVQHYGLAFPGRRPGGSASRSLRMTVNCDDGDQGSYTERSSKIDDIPNPRTGSLGQNDRRIDRDKGLNRTTGRSGGDRDDPSRRSEIRGSKLGRLKRYGPRARYPRRAFCRWTRVMSEQPTGVIIRMISDSACHLNVMKASLRCADHSTLSTRR